MYVSNVVSHLVKLASDFKVPSSEKWHTQLVNEPSPDSVLFEDKWSVKRQNGAPQRKEEIKQRLVKKEKIQKNSNVISSYYVHV